MANLSALLGLGGGATGEEIYPNVDVKEGLIAGLTAFVDLLPLQTNKGIIDKLTVNAYSTNPYIKVWLRVTIDGGTPFEINKSLLNTGVDKGVDVLLNYKYDTSIRIEARTNATGVYSYYSYELTRRWQ